MPVTEEMVAAMNGARPKAAYMGCDLLCVFDDADTVRNMTVDQDKVRALDGLLLHVTAPGTDVDCVSRSFAPKCNVAEDPVCGSGHCHIVPYWVQTLGKDTLVADQASRRGGTLCCTQAGDRIRMNGARPSTPWRTSASTERENRILPYKARLHRCAAGPCAGGDMHER